MWGLWDLAVDVFGTIGVGTASSRMEGEKRIAKRAGGQLADLSLLLAESVTEHFAPCLLTTITLCDLRGIQTSFPPPTPSQRSYNKPGAHVSARITSMHHWRQR